MSVKGADTLDVPARLTRKYKLSLYALKDGVTHCKVTFQEANTGEIMFYELVFTALPMEVCVRLCVWWSAPTRSSIGILPLSRPRTARHVGASAEGHRATAADQKPAHSQPTGRRRGNHVV